MTEGFPVRLRELRGSKSMIQFAGEIGVHQQTVANYENGIRSPTVDFLEKLAVVIGPSLDLNWLILGTNAKPAAFVPADTLPESTIPSAASQDAAQSWLTDAARFGIGKSDAATQLIVATLMLIAPPDKGDGA